MIDRQTDNHINDVKQLIISLQGKKVFLITKSKLHYHTNNILIVGEKSIQFNDKFGYKVLMSIDEIKQISEVR